MEVVEKLTSKKSRGKKWIKRLLYFFLFLFLLINFMAFMHARKFGNFTPGATKITADTPLSTGQQIKGLFLGIDLPRPENTSRPNVAYEEISLKNENGKVAAWWVPLDSVQKTVIISHGYGACMSKMLPYADAFRSMGMNVLLFDSTGSGDSEGNSCTIGVKESKDLKTVYDYAKENIAGDIYLFGASMGAAITLRGIAKEGLQPKAVIVQCPFATMKDATKAKFREAGLPFTGMGHLLMFWGGVQNGYNPFKHNPASYAKENKFPTLLIWGEQDELVTQKETDLLFENLAGKKALLTLAKSGHVLPVVTEPEKWKKGVREFLKNHNL